MDDREDILPETYRCQNGCHNCIHVFKMYEYDSGTSHFCTLNASPRPPCGSVAMKESFDFKEDPYSENEPASMSSEKHPWEMWDEWHKGRLVDEYGICEHHKAKELSAEINGSQYIWCGYWRIRAGCNPRCSVKCPEQQRIACMAQQVLDKDRRDRERAQQNV